MKKILILVACLCSTFLIVLLLVVAFPNSFIDLYISRIERTLDIDISFSYDQVSLFKEWHLKNIKISSKAGYTLYVEDIALQLPFFSSLKREININCKAKNLKFYKELPLLDSVCNLLSIQPIRDIGFDTVDATITLKRKKIKMDHLKVVSKDIMILGNGRTDIKEGLMDYNLKFLFSENITEDINDLIKITLLTRESPSWMSLNIEVKGNYKKPRLNLKSDFLDLNIKGIDIR